MKVFVLTVISQDCEETLVFASQEKALGTVAGDLADHYHFDTDEPYCSPEQLQLEQDSARGQLKDYGNYETNDGEITYYLEEKEVIE